MSAPGLSQLRGMPCLHGRSVRLCGWASVLVRFIVSACAARQPSPPEPPASAAIPTPRTDPLGVRRGAQLETLVAQGHPQLVFLGDSITEGWAFLGQPVWERFYAARAPLNLGSSGDRTEHV